MVLKKYIQKRDFSITPEPKSTQKKYKHNTLPVFCIQKHAARRLHYDFRLEHKGVLLSWAIPKGLPETNHEKRLAIQVEDHPYEYRHFEGVIPKGQYGAGTVEIWDEGTFTLSGAETKQEIEKKMDASLKRGIIEVNLFGERYQGIYALIKMHHEQEENHWICIKKTGSSFENDAPPQKIKLPKFFTPMLAQLIEKPFDDPEWLFEIKWDGYRALAFIDKKEVALYSRNHLSFNKQFPLIVENLSHYPFQAIMDGEIVVLDKNGHSDFQLIQNYNPKTDALFYYVFDLLFYNGKDLRSYPIIKRKELLKKILSENPRAAIRFSDHIFEKGVEFFQQAKQHHLEGIIGKQCLSIYESRRSSDWVKIKAKREQEAIIAGFTAGRGSRSYFGALLLGIYNEEGKLEYIGHTGGGFNEKSLEMVYKKMQPLIQKKCPFEKTPKTNASPTWIKPKLVCQIVFSEWTQEGIARQPIFKGLRIDKDPKEVKREFSIIGASKSVKNSTGYHLTNLDKMYWPKQGYTKQNLIEYYQKIAPFILPYLKNRPIMLKRFPEGVNAESFIQKDTHALHLPDWVETITLIQESKPLQYILIQNQNTLEYVANLGAIELHVFNAPAQHLENPDYLVIDLDPEDISFSKVVELAQAFHQLLEALKLPHCCKTSGKRGLHIYLPMKGQYTFEQVYQFGQVLTLLIHKQHPKITSLERSPSKRQKKVYLDVLQNRKSQTVIAPYSLRGNEFATVSTPLEWSEVNEKLNPQDFTIETVPERVKKKGDLFKKVLGRGIELKEALEKLAQKFPLDLAFAPALALALSYK